MRTFPLIKEREILAKMLEIVNSGKVITLEEDWGDNTLTIEIDGAHSHCGVNDGSFDTMIDHLHGLLVNGRGMSWAK